MHDDRDDELRAMLRMIQVSLAIVGCVALAALVLAVWAVL